MGKDLSGVDTSCWNCGGEMSEYVACELICTDCGFIRDCSDP